MSYCSDVNISKKAVLITSNHTILTMQAHLKKANPKFEVKVMAPLASANGN